MSNENLHLLALWALPILIEGLVQIKNRKFNGNHLGYAAIPGVGYFGIAHLFKRG